MRAMLLAAGRGRRMGALTQRTAKPLLRAGGRPLIEWHLERLAGNGVSRVVINLSWHGTRVRKALGDGARYGVEIVYSDEGAEALETAGGIVQALAHLGDQPFLVVNADVVTDHPLRLAPLAARDLGRLVLVDNPAHHPRGDYGLHRGRVTLPPPRLTFAGISLLHPALFAGVPAGKRPLAPLLAAAIGSGRIAGEHYRGYWSDAGTAARLAAADRWLRRAVRPLPA